jgi:hypothetical protein
MSDAPPPPPFGADPEQPPPTAPYPQQPYQQPYPQQPYPQQPYQQPHPQPPYGAPQYPPGYAPVAPDHPQATLLLVLGIVSIVLCNVLGPVVWVMGNRAIAEIDASGGRLGGRGNAQAGRICGIIGTVILGFSIVAILFLVVVAAGGIFASGY